MGSFVFKSGASCLLKWGELSSKNGASCLLKSGELSWGEFYVGRVVLGRVVFGASCPDSVYIVGRFFLLLSERKQYRHIETTKHKFGKFCNNMKRIPYGYKEGRSKTVLKWGELSSKVGRVVF